MMKVTVDEKKKTLTIELPLLPPRASKSGKNLTIATTSGNFASDATFKGQPIIVGVNAYIKNIVD
jgi:hypothetical protein